MVLEQLDNRMKNMEWKSWKSYRDRHIPEIGSILHSAEERRTEFIDVGRDGYTMTINSHMGILESLDPA